VTNRHGAKAATLEELGDVPRRLALPASGSDRADRHDRHLGAEHGVLRTEQDEVRAGRRTSLALCITYSWLTSEYEKMTSSTSSLSISEVSSSSS